MLQGTLKSCEEKIESLTSERVVMNNKNEKLNNENTQLLVKIHKLTENYVNLFIIQVFHVQK